MNRNLPFNRTEIILKPKKPPSIKGRTLKIPHPFWSCLFMESFKLQLTRWRYRYFPPTVVQKNQA